MALSPVTPAVLAVEPRHGPHREHRFQFFLVVADGCVTMARFFIQRMIFHLSYHIAPTLRLLVSSSVQAYRHYLFSKRTYL
jgi:hypothetical protein